MSSPDVVDTDRSPYSSTVSADDCGNALDGVEPTAPGYGEHLPFHAILQRCGAAWRAYLADVPGVLRGAIVPHLSADFRAEVHIGELDIAVAVTQVGTSSFTIVCDVHQDGRTAATVSVVLVNFDYARRRPAPLDEDVRRLLEAERRRG